MTSLAEVYEGHVGEVASPRRVYLGVGLFLVGVVLTAVGLIVATTDVIGVVGLDRMAAWRRAGVLAGVGVPAVVGGVFTVLPSSKRIKAAATIGAGVSLLGVALFWYAYPAHWAGYGRQLTLPVTGIYFFGNLTAVWCLFVGIANLKQRNDPGGMVSLMITKEGGETKVVEVEESDLAEGSLGTVTGAGGIGVFGADPDGNVETQTNDPSGSTAGSGTPASGGSADAGHDTRAAPSASGADGWTTSETTTHPAGATATSDGGTDDATITSLNDNNRVKTPRESARQYADRYCGNCQHFRYVRAENGMQPYCGFDGEPMDDMEACDQWEPNH